MSAKKILRLEKKRRAMEREMSKLSDERLAVFHRQIAGDLQVAISQVTRVIEPIKQCYYATAPQAQSAESILRRLQKLQADLATDYELLFPADYVVID
jgi:hypothetical protein